MGRNRNLFNLGNVAGEQILVRTGISLISSDDDRPEIPFEDDFSSKTAARFGDLSVPLASVKWKKKREARYIHPLFELTDCVQSPDVDDGASSFGVIVCVIAPVCGLQNFMWYYLVWQHFF